MTNRFRRFSETSRDGFSGNRSTLSRGSFFFGAIVHTFLAARFRKIAYNYQQSYDAIEYLLHASDGPPDFGKKHDKLLFRALLSDNHFDFDDQDYSSRNEWTV
jgi:hypothetical protein